MLRRSTTPILATVVLSGLATVLVTALPRLDFAYRQHELHVGLETAAALIGLLASYLLFGRFRRRKRLDDLVLFVALSLFALSNLFFAALPAMIVDVGSAKFSTWVALSGRLLGTVALAAGAFAPPRRVRLPGPAMVLALLAPVIALGLTALFVGLFVSSFPSGVEAELTPEASGRPRLIGHVAVLAVQIAVSALFAAAAVGFIRRSDPERDEFVRWLGIASILGAFAHFNYFLYPSLYTEWVYVGDAFRLLFYVVVLVAALREISSYWEAASRAAVLDARRRLARSLHDGVAQELALVGMNLKRLDPENENVARALSGVERGLADARAAIAALRAPGDEPVGTEGLLDEASQEARNALTKILSEAITSAARNGQVNPVHVELENGGRLRLRVRDGGGGFGRELETLRDQVTAVGGELHVKTVTGIGTEIEVLM